MSNSLSPEMQNSSHVVLCPVCDISIPLNSCMETTSAEGHRIAYVRCKECGMLVMDAPPDESFLQTTYSEKYYGIGKAKFVRWIERPRNFFYHWRARFVRKWAARPQGRVLDIGCGSGRFVEGMAEHGWTIYATELPGPAFERASQVAGLKLVRGDQMPLPFEDHFFDAVSLWHVFEHLEEPKRMLKECTRILKPDGVLVIEVPSASSWQARLFGSRWFHLDPPRHIYQYTETALYKLLRAEGFSPIEQSTFSFEMGGYGFLQSALNLFMEPRDLLYDSLHMNIAGSVPRGKLLASRLLFFVLAPFAVAFMVLETLFRKGAVLRCVCKKNTAL